MIRSLVAFGDSWTYGDELIDPTIPGVSWISDPRNTEYRLGNGFPGLIARHFNLDIENHASNGQSLQSMMWTFDWWLDNTPKVDEYIVLIGLTHPARTSWWFSEKVLKSWDPPWDRYLHSVMIESANGRDFDSWFDFHKYWRTKSTDDEWVRRNYQSAVYFFSGICARLKIPYVMFNVFEDMPNIPHNPTVNGTKGLFHLLNDTEPAKQNPDGHWGEAHPNAQGHRIIADYLINEIKSRIIV